MKFILPILLAAASCSAFARLADTIDQAEERYGLPKAEKTPKGMDPLLEQATHEYTFLYQGWRIRCAFLLATDGQEYAVREEYSKELAPGRSGLISDAERQAIFAGESAGKQWEEQGPVQWGRQDRARASLKGGILRLELPHAYRHEQQLARLRALNAPPAAAALPRF